MSPGKTTPRAAGRLDVLMITIVMTVAVALFLGELARAVDWPFLRSSSWSRLALLCAVLIAFGLSPRLGLWRPIKLRRTAVAQLPAIVLAGFAVYAASLPLADRTQWFLGGDNTRHLVYVAQERAVGFLEYADNPYPRAWHTFVALMWSSTGATGGAPGLLSLVELMSAASWLLFVALLITTSGMAVQLAHRAGLPPAWAPFSGLVAGLLLLTPPFFANYQALGFQTSIVASLCLSVSARVAMDRPASLSSVATCGLSAAVVANTWQLLLPAAAVPAVWCAMSTVRSRRRALLPVTFIGVGSLVLAWPGLVAVTTTIGVAQASQGDVEAPLPLTALLCGVAATAFALSRRWPSIPVVAATAGSLAVTAIYIAGRAGVSLSFYYPSKTLWAAAVLMVAPLAVVVARCLFWSWTASGFSAVASRSLLTGVGAVVAAFCLTSPLNAFRGVWSNIDAVEVYRALRTPDAFNAQAVWIPARPQDGMMARLLLDFERVPAGLPMTDQVVLSPRAECAHMTAAERPTLLTSGSLPQVRDQYPCHKQLTVLPVR